MYDTFYALILKPMAYRDNETLVSFITERAREALGLRRELSDRPLDGSLRLNL